MSNDNNRNAPDIDSSIKSNIIIDDALEPVVDDVKWQQSNCQSDYEHRNLTDITHAVNNRESKIKNV